jgi:transglutaminase-like putative cysteine protease
MITSYQNSGATLDASNITEGYVTASYSGGINAKVLITKNGGTTYTYDLAGNGVSAVFPLSEGSGSYNVEVLYHVSGDQYAVAVDETVNAQLRDEAIPFLYPNDYVSYDENSLAVAKSAELAAGATSKLEVVSNIYNYVVSNIRYDENKANQVSSGALVGYVPNVDATLVSGKGICCDYAALLCAMLRAQQIPARMEYGIISGGGCHAWVSVYVPDQGWVNNAVRFDGANWTRLDPTFAAGVGAQFAGDGTSYQVQYCY